MKNHRPYTGVTGFVTNQDIEIAKWAGQRVPSGHCLMAGILVSHKTLTGVPVTNRRYPTIEQARKILTALKEEGNIWPVAHYNTSGCKDPLCFQLLRLVRDLPGISGIQMNIVKPRYEDLLTFKEACPDVSLILQVNSSSVPSSEVGDTTHYIRTYEGIVDYALLDLSGGRGKVVSMDWVSKILKHWPTDSIRPGIAGGLGPDCGPLILSLKDKFPLLDLSEICFDSESNIRIPAENPLPETDYQDDLSGDLVLKYLNAVVDTLTQVSKV